LIDELGKTTMGRPTTIDKRPRVLCVDDEPNVLDSLRRQLHGEFAVVGVGSGLEALALLAADSSFSVLMSDMRMTGMDGVAVLREARLVRPETVRVLLTGQADIEDAVAAVNDGNIFRFLVKPSPRPVLLKALTDAVDQHRLVTAEKELLELTLRGSIGALLETLSLANPMAFARATRIQGIVRQMIEATGPDNAWCIEVAAMVSQLGTVVLAPETLSKLNSGAPLSAEEELQVRVLPWHAERLLVHIPRLEVVRQIIRDQSIAYDHSALTDATDPDRAAAQAQFSRLAAPGAQMLRIAVDLEGLEARGTDRAGALSILGRRQGSYSPVLLGALSATAGPASNGPGLSLLMANELCPGMTIMSDITDSSGRLLVGRGYRVTESLLERIRNWNSATFINEPIYVTIE
jgi:response regulator RpfG family c-di-GMP phosphodiesterase